MCTGERLLRRGHSPATDGHGGLSVRRVGLSGSGIGWFGPAAGCAGVTAEIVDDTFLALVRERVGEHPVTNR
jgi:hypothetical protein